MPDFNVSAAYRPTGDQPQAIASLSERVLAGDRYQTLLGATGTGKTATMAWIIEQVQKPTLVIAHNKTLAAQLCNEFREFFPNNAVEYFVSYYDYYQPEAYVPAGRPLHREGRLDQRRHRPPAPCRDERAAAAPRRRHRRLGVVHLRARLARASTASRPCSCPSGRRPTATRCCGSSSTSSTSATTRSSPAAASASAATSSRCSRRRSRPPTGSRSSATRSSRSPTSTRCTGEVLRRLDHLAVFPATQYVTDRPIDRARARGDPGGARGAGPAVRGRRGSCSRRTGSASAPSTTWR